jgi:hypothetical protein
LRGALCDVGLVGSALDTLAGHRNAYTEKVDAWVAEHLPKPSLELTRRASLAIRRILGNRSELRELWEESGDSERWHSAVEDLATRLGSGAPQAP